MSKVNLFSTRLFPKSSFITGIGSAFNLFGNYYNLNYSDSPGEADLLAMRSDWNAVGNDIRKSIEVFSNKINSDVKSARTIQRTECLK